MNTEGRPKVFGSAADPQVGRREKFDAAERTCDNRSTGGRASTAARARASDRRESRSLVVSGNHTKLPGEHGTPRGPVATAERRPSHAANVGANGHAKGILAPRAA